MINNLTKRIEALEKKKPKAEMFWQNQDESIADMEQRYNKTIKETDLIVCWRN